MAEVGGQWQAGDRVASFRLPLSWTQDDMSLGPPAAVPILYTASQKRTKFETVLAQSYKDQL